MLRGAARKSYATEQRALATLRRPSRSPLVYVSPERIHSQLVIQPPKRRGLATVSDGEKNTAAAPLDGPMREYDVRVQEGRLRDDEHQRGKLWLTPAHSFKLTCADSIGIIQNLQDLFEALKHYEQPKVVHPEPESLHHQQKSSFFGSLFGGVKKHEKSAVPANLPKGLYMYGDVGCGKTMLMDLFFDTLPPNIKSKTRIHFHNFMQDVHKRMHVVKMKYGNDFDALPMVAADIAELSGVLCFDEFQCTDVADAMILRQYVFDSRT